MVQQLSGIASRETLLAQLPFVEDVQKELEAIEEENNGYSEDFMSGGGEDDRGGILAETNRQAV